MCLAKHAGIAQLSMFKQLRKHMQNRWSWNGCVLSIYPLDMHIKAMNSRRMQNIAVLRCMEIQRFYIT
jgi:hypothetical protein